MEVKKKMERGTREYRSNERKRKKWKERTDKCGRREINGRKKGARNKQQERERKNERKMYGIRYTVVSVVQVYNTRPSEDVCRGRLSFAVFTDCV
jgi:hypothetical protein